MSSPRDDDESGWRFDADEVGDDSDESATAPADDAAPADADEGYRPPPIEPEPIAAENVLFVLVGVVGAVVLLFGGI